MKKIMQEISVGVVVVICLVAQNTLALASETVDGAVDSYVLQADNDNVSPAEYIGLRVGDTDVYQATRDTTTTWSQGNTTINVDTDNAGAGQFIVADWNGSSSTINTIVSDAQSTVISATTNDGSGGASTVTNSLTVAGDGTTNSGAFTNTGLTTLNGGLTMDGGAFTVADTSGNVATTGTLTAGGLTTLNGGLTMDSGVFTVADGTGNVHTSGTLDVDSTANFDSSITVAGNSNLNGATNNIGTTQVSTNNIGTFAGSSTTVGATGAGTTSLVGGTSSIGLSSAGGVAVTGNTTVTGTLSSTGNFSVNTSMFTVDATNGNTSIAGNLDMTSGNINNLSTIYSGSASGSNLVLNGNNATINSGNGNSSLAVTNTTNTLTAATTNSIVGGTGNDITATTGNNTITATAGSNTISANANNQSNTLSATGTNGINYITANATTGTNNIEAKNNNIGVATANSINTIGNATATNVMTGATNTITGTTNTIQSTNLTQTITQTNTSTTIASSTGSNYLVVGADQSGSITDVNGVTNTFTYGTAVNGGMLINGDLGVNGNIYTLNNLANASVAVANNGLNIEGSSNTVSLISDTDTTGGNGRAQVTLTPTTGGLTVVNTTTGHTEGLNVGQTNTVLSGGTHSTTLTLDDNGATFADSGTGGPTRVTGVADGESDFDAVNYRQLKQISDKAYAGAASAIAMANIPAVLPGKKFSVGGGIGTYAGQTAGAIGVKTVVGKKQNITLSLSGGYAADTPSVGGGVGLSF